jgi:hypothetical protein
MKKKKLLSLNDIIQFKQYKQVYINVLRQINYVEKNYISFLLWKLNVENIYILPKYNIWLWRSFYNRKKKSKKRYGYLFNLIFAIDLWLPFKNYKIKGYINEKNLIQQGWALNNFDYFENNYYIYNILYHFLVFKQKVTLNFVNLSWLKLKPKDWITLNSDESVFDDDDDDFEYNRNIEYILILDKRNHKFQFKINCNLFNIINFRRNIQISPWFLKVLLLRGFKYPAIINYKQIKLINLLAYFGHKQVLPWDCTIADDGIWQIDPIALILIDISRDLTFSYRNDNITEYLIKKRWKDLLAINDTLSLLLKDVCIDDSYMCIKIINRAFENNYY